MDGNLRVRPASFPLIRMREGEVFSTLRITGRRIPGLGMWQQTWIVLTAPDCRKGAALACERKVSRRFVMNLVCWDVQRTGTA